MRNDRMQRSHENSQKTPTRRIYRRHTVKREQVPATAGYPSCLCHEVQKSSPKQRHEQIGRKQSQTEKSQPLLYQFTRLAHWKDYWTGKTIRHVWVVEELCQDSRAEANNPWNIAYQKDSPTQLLSWINGCDSKEDNACEVSSVKNVKIASCLSESDRNKTKVRGRARLPKTSHDRWPIQKAHEYRHIQRIIYFRYTQDTVNTQTRKWPAKRQNCFKDLNIKTKKIIVSICNY